MERGLTYIPSGISTQLYKPIAHRILLALYPCSQYLKRILLTRVPTAEHLSNQGLRRQFCPPQESDIPHFLSIPKFNLGSQH
jgi:hypothetical protein